MRLVNSFNHIDQLQSVYAKPTLRDMFDAMIVDYDLLNMDKLQTMIASGNYYNLTYAAYAITTITGQVLPTEIISAEVKAAIIADILQESYFPYKFAYLARACIVFGISLSEFPALDADINEGRLLTQKPNKNLIELDESIRIAGGIAMLYPDKSELFQLPVEYIAILNDRWSPLNSWFDLIAYSEAIFACRLLWPDEVSRLYLYNGARANLQSYLDMYDINLAEPPHDAHIYEVLVNLFAICADEIQIKPWRVNLDKSTEREPLTPALIY